MSHESGEAYVSLTELSKEMGSGAPSYIIKQWISQQETFRFLNAWEQLHNPNYRPEPWTAMQEELLQKRTLLSAKCWCRRLDPMGIQYAHARGVFVHPSIAQEFLLWGKNHRFRSLTSWESYYRAASGFYKQHGHLLVCKGAAWEGLKLGRWIRQQREYYNSKKLTEEQVCLLEALDMVWNYRPYHWGRMLKAAGTFYENHGHLVIPSGTMISFLDGAYDLHGWLEHLRLNRKQLSSAKKQQLEAIGIVWNFFESAWEMGYEHAAAFSRRCGHLRVQETYTDETGYSLGVWIRHQRDDYHEGKLTAKQVQRLNNIHMLWRANERIQTSYDEQALYFYMKKIFPDAINCDRRFAGCELDVLIPSIAVGIEYDGPRYHGAGKDLKKNETCRGKVFLIRIRHHKLPVIGVSDRDIHYIYLDSEHDLEAAVLEIQVLLAKRFEIDQKLIPPVNLEKDRQAICEQLSNCIDSLWDKKLEDAKAYHQTHGNLDIPYGFLVNSYDLGSWISEQRKQYRSNRLPQYKINALNELGIKWNCKTEIWNLRYQQLKDYLQTHKTLVQPKDRHSKEATLYHWVQGQLKSYRRGTLSEEQCAMLEKIGVELEKQTDSHFNAMCEKLRQYKEIHGNCIVPLDCAGNTPQSKTNNGQRDETHLGRWAQRMRMSLSKGLLPQERAERLLQLGLPLDNKHAKFLCRLALAEEYAKERGNLLIPQKYEKDGCRLGKWINSLRVRYSHGKLTPYQIKALEALGMVWTV